MDRNRNSKKKKPDQTAPLTIDISKGTASET